MAILITGGAGFLGSALAASFIERGEKVVVFGRSLQPSKDDAQKLVKVRGDISSFHEVLNVVKDHKVENIIHLAAMLTVPSEANPWASVDTNAMGAYNLLEAARLFGVKKFLISSSMGAFTADAEGVVTDDMQQRPSTIYGVCKVFAELLGLYYQKKFGLDFRGLRLPQIVGPGAKTFSLGQFTPWSIEAAIKGEPFEVWVPEDFVQPMAYIKDVLKCYLTLYDAPAEKLQTRVYNMGQITPPPTAGQVVEEVKKYYPNARITFKPDPALAATLASNPRIFKNDKAEKEWGWKFSYSLAGMVKDFIEEYKKSH